MNCQTQVWLLIKSGLIIIIPRIRTYLVTLEIPQGNYECVGECED